MDAHRTPAPWIWISGIVGAIIALGTIEFFFQTHDPMLLIFGAIAIAIVAGVMRPRGYWGYHPWGAPPSAAPPVQVVKVRCASCRALNDEEARFCQQCGKGV